MKINKDSRWNTCTIAHEHKHSHFRPKATGLRYLFSSLGGKPSKKRQRPTCVHVSTGQHADRRRLSALAVIWLRHAPVLIAKQTTQSLCSLCLAGAVGAAPQLDALFFNCLGDRLWGSRWSSLPSPSPWRRLDSPAGIRFWLARGEGLWSPKRGCRHLTPRMLDTQTHGHS